MENLDLKNKKIIYELEQDSRQSLSSIAKKVGLSKETVFHRIKGLEHSGIIRKYLTEINIYKLGFQFYPLLIRFQNTTPIIEQEIFDFLQKNRHTAWLTQCEGAWDLNATLIAEGHVPLAAFFDDLVMNYGHYIADKQVFITTEIHYFKRGFWLGKSTQQTISTGGDEHTTVEQRDFQLLRILSSNARIPLVELGKMLKTDPKNVAYRIRKLQKEGIIQGSRILVDFSKLGYKFYKVWLAFSNFKPEDFKRLTTFFRNHSNIIWATKLIGCYDLSFEMEVNDVAEFRDIINDLKTRFSGMIQKHESLLIFEETVMNYLPDV
ncbi:Lrp/AsnC family transcriptional regulator [Candidatus Woesearchaeota archaeon]|nr:Lrp/AsnC family transcriptional regulator [Candidatus Woesearchaeota archaeon]